MSTAERILLLSLLLSLLVHSALWEAALHAPPLDFSNTDNAVEVSINDKPSIIDRLKSNKMKIFVRQALPPLSMLKPGLPKDPHYSSEQDINVEKEMQAKKTGLTQNRDLGRDKTSDAQKAMGKFEGTRDGDLAQNEIPQLGTNGLARRALAEESTSENYLPDVAEGPITALNSERFVYYSFFSRISERIYPPWVQNVQDAVARLPLAVIRQVGDHDLITEIEILLNPRGEYVKTLVNRTSGVKIVDQAAIDAFANAAIFPNPPREMVKDDGYIHLKYSFVVEQNRTPGLARDTR